MVGAVWQQGGQGGEGGIMAGVSERAGERHGGSLTAGRGTGLGLSWLAGWAGRGLAGWAELAGREGG